MFRINIQREILIEAFRLSSNSGYVGYLGGCILMVIKRIKDIKNCGAFDSFSWLGSDLKKFNLFYGWNGSGKTTISRIFSFFEKESITNPDFSEWNFTVQTENNDLFKKKDISSNELSLRVFNEDFIKENFSFEESKAKKIVIIGKENIEIQKEIASLQEQYKKESEELTIINAKKRILPKIDEILTEAGSAVTKQFGNTPLANHKYYGRSYNRNKVGARITEGKVNSNNLESLIITNQTDIDDYREIIKSDKDKISLELAGLPDLSGIFSGANELLESSIQVDGSYDFRDDVELYEWTEKGYHIHKKRDLTECQFCRNKLPTSLIDKLGLIFTDELQKAKDSIDTSIKELASSSLFEMSLSLDSSKLFPKFTQDYLDKKAVIEKEAENVKTVIESLINNLEKKKSSLNNFKNITFIKYPKENIEKLNATIKTINSLITQHNQCVEHNCDEVEKAAENLELHIIAQVLKNREYFKNKALIDDFDRRIVLLETKLNKINQEIKTKKALIQNVSIAVERMNKFLEEFFGQTQIYLEVLDLDKEEIGYVLKRRTEDAKHLSEGEKSVIALIYFLLKLQEDGCDKRNCTIVIDDPVDSQDGTFLFRTFGLLKRQLKDVNQLLILTHNFEFFNLVRDWFNAKDLKDKSQMYFLSLEKRTDQHEAKIENLPSMLKDYKSEYQYLFSRIFEYANDIKHLDEPLIANISRKVLEYFACFKWSCKTTEEFTSIILNRFVADENVLKKGTGDFIVKFLHEYSHGQDFSRPISTSMLEGKTIAKNVIQFIKIADTEHYKQLKKMILPNS